MKKLLFMMISLSIGFGFAMEEKAEKIGPFRSELNKPPVKTTQEIKEILTLEKIPSELFLPILIYFSAEPNLTRSLNTMKNFRLISKRFNDLITDRKFTEIMVNFWSKKYTVPKTCIPIAWSPTHFSDLPDELIILIISQLTSGQNFTKEITALINLGYTNKRFNDLTTDKSLVKTLLENKKYDVPKAHVAILWNSPAAKEWLKIQDLQTLEETPTTSWCYYRKPIFWAIRLNRKDVIKILLAKGIDVNNDYADGRNVFMQAISVAKDLGLDIIQLFIEKGAKINSCVGMNTNQTNCDGTPLSTAIGALEPDVVKLLLERRADTTLCVYGQTAIEQAQDREDSIKEDLTNSVDPNEINEYKSDLRKIKTIIELLKQYGGK